MTSRRLASILVPLAAASLLAGCGDDPADPVGSGAGAPESTPESTLPPSTEAGTGTGEMTIAGVQFPFDADVCALYPVNHRGRDYGLYVHGTGTVSGETYEVEAFTAISESGNVIETLQVNPGGGELAVATHVVEAGESDSSFEVAASLLTGELEFVATPELPGGAGSVAVACS